jgi:glutamate mutase epsilon subunit
MDIDRLGAYVVRTTIKTGAVNIYSLLTRNIGVKNLTVNLSTAGADVVDPGSVVVLGKLKNGKYLIRESYDDDDVQKQMQLGTTLFLKEEVANG